MSCISKKEIEMERETCSFQCIRESSVEEILNDPAFFIHVATHLRILKKSLQEPNQLDFEPIKQKIKRDVCVGSDGRKRSGPNHDLGSKPGMSTDVARQKGVIV